MVEIFNYTERVVNMVRPRRVLFMAIGMCFRIRTYCAPILMTRQMVWLRVRR
jgi:hypothetical protein